MFKSTTKLKTTIFTLFFSLLTLSSPQTSFAFTELPENFRPTYQPNIKLASTEPAYYGVYFLQLLAGSLLYFIGPVAILIITIAGLRGVTSVGKEEQLTKVKQTLIWAIVGLTIIMLSYVIINSIITIYQQTVPIPQNQTNTSTPPPNNGGLDSTPAPADAKDSE